MKTRNRLAFFAVAAAVWMGGASTLLAQRVYGSMSERGYQEMRRLAERLDQTAQHAADQARHQESWAYQHDSRFVRAVTDFARRADRFNERMGNYRAAPWRVDDDLRSLLRSAQYTQGLARRSREADNHTLADWNDAVAVLNRMIRLYDSDVRRSGRYDWNEAIPDFREDGEYRHPYGIPVPEDRRYSGRSSELVRLAHELNGRASRAHELAEGLAGADQGWRHRYFETIHHFNDQVRDFDARVSSGQFDYRQLREQALHLLDDARRADQEMRQNNVFPEVWEDWRGAMLTLQRILTILGT